MDEGEFKRCDSRCSVEWSQPCEADAARITEAAREEYLRRLLDRLDRAIVYGE